MNVNIPIVASQPIQLPAPHMLLVNVPLGVKAGQFIQVQAPDGQMIQAKVPLGVSQFYVTVPAKLHQMHTVQVVKNSPHMLIKEEARILLITVSMSL